MRYLTKNNNYANRGMGFENEINMTNEYYRLHNIALIYKKSTPIRIVSVDYNLAKINEAYFEKPSTLDYNGIYKGKYLDFDAKECISKTSFPLANIHLHQFKHIEQVILHGGISFIIVNFVKRNEIYLLFGRDLLNYINNNEKKSIPIEYFEKCAYQVGIKFNPRIDYIKIIDKYMEEKDESKI